MTEAGLPAGVVNLVTCGAKQAEGLSIPVPVSVFPFSGRKKSFFGDLHTMGKDGIRFFTDVKAVTTTWFDEEEMKRENIDTWDGMLNTPHRARK
jgi:malonate-semialdehyde dehydrogenase (acetylating) / methylmalonate-semialdehyde dehydrogenase